MISVLDIVAALEDKVRDGIPDEQEETDIMYMGSRLTGKRHSGSASEAASSVATHSDFLYSFASPDGNAHER